MSEDKSRYISNCLALKIKVYPMRRLGPSGTSLQNLTSHITEELAQKPVEMYNELKA